MTNLALNDDLDALFAGDTGPVRVAPVRAAPEFKQAAQRWIENCPRCHGTGQTRWGVCFKCKGAAKKTFKTAPETRAANCDAAADRKARIEQDSIEGFKAANPAAYEWLVATAPRWDLATSLLAGLHRYGSLTEKQMTIVTNGIDRDAARAELRAQKTADAPAADTAGIDRLKASFDQAVAYSAEKGLKLSPRVTIAGVTISPAKANSKNPGALYVKAGGEYLGKIAGGRFFAVSACTPDQQAKVLGFIADPAEAAKVYGQTTGTCCVCNATLRSEWKKRGIGPICAQKFGVVIVAYIPMIDPTTGEIDHALRIERADLMACREYGGPNPPPSYVRSAHSWSIDRARAESRQWRREHGLPVDEPTVMFHSFAPDTNE